MILRFLRLFPQFRFMEHAVESWKREEADWKEEEERLREALQQESSRALVLQDRLDSAEHERQRLWDRLDIATKEMVTAYQLQVNQAWMKDHGTAPYPEAPAPPAKPVFTPPEQSTINRRSLPSEAVAAKTREFIQGQLKQ